MPGRTLPTLPQADVEAHNNAKSCYVTIGAKVYDVTAFLPDHPGGGDLILEYGGKDVSEIMKDEISHFHSEAAYDILDESLVGFVAKEPIIKTVVDSNHPDQIVPLPPTEEGKRELGEHGADVDNLQPRQVYAATGMSSAEDLSKETDANIDYKVHQFLDLNRPLFPQVWYGGFSKDFYLEQVHRPRHYKGGASAPLFGNFLEPLSKTAWWVIPMVWLPPVIYGTLYANGGLSSPFETAAYWIIGIGFWTFFEYVLHRCLFHIDKYGSPRILVRLKANQVSKILTRQSSRHHCPLPTSWHPPLPSNGPLSPSHASDPIHRPCHALLEACTRGFLLRLLRCHCGLLWRHLWVHLLRLDPLLLAPPQVSPRAYMPTDQCMLMSSSLPLHYRELKKYHLQHHFADFENGFGVTSRFWDRIFGTELEYTKVLKTA